MKRRLLLQKKTASLLAAAAMQFQLPMQFARKLKYVCTNFLHLHLGEKKKEDPSQVCKQLDKKTY